MTQPTPAELREAAERLHNLVRFCSNEVKKDVDLILSHFPADSETPITADWLREEFEFLIMPDATYVAAYSESVRIETVRDTDAWRVYLLDYPIRPYFTTRQQFRTLAGLLGIEPKRKGE